MKSSGDEFHLYSDKALLKREVYSYLFAVLVQIVVYSLVLYSGASLSPEREGLVWAVALLILVVIFIGHLVWNISMAVNAVVEHRVAPFKAYSFTQVALVNHRANEEHKWSELKKLSFSPMHYGINVIRKDRKNSKTIFRMGIDKEEFSGARQFIIENAPAEITRGILRM